MTYPVDLLGRPPIMREIAHQTTGQAFKRAPAEQPGRVRVLVPHVGNNSGISMEPHPVTIPAAPWEDVS